ncbi:sigma-70 family RNA polymerase sigma factor [Tabrizicola caldifontis]|uniref:sigma-70 family RNA polymerase sigma factor n=1 Tax=Tabrizicola caldifontis TaxID=2528036 RepID=UPI001080F2CD|nr:sigma-70 family RNA polymerase sigma factor [Rhodobacter sp. YIM 73028]
MSDDRAADLIKRCAAQDRAAFRALYRGSVAKLMGVMLRILKDRAAAEDALQEAYIRIWQRAGSYDPAKGPGMAWLVAIARNLAIDRLRARAETLNDPGPVATGDEAARTQAPIPAPEEVCRIGDCLATLEPDGAAAVRHAYLDGLSYLDLAAQHGVPLNIMRNRLRHDLLKLRECLDQ